MNKKFLMAAAGLFISTAVVADSDYYVDAGLGLGFECASFKLKSEKSKEEEGLKNNKYLVVKAHVNALIDDAWDLGINAKYGFGLGKTKYYEKDAAGTETTKMKSKGHVFGTSAHAGYRFTVSDSFFVTPMAGYTYNQYKVKGKDSGITFDVSKLSYHGPFAGVKLGFQPSDDVTVGLGFKYVFAKAKEHTYDISKRGHVFDTQLTLDYQLDDDWSLGFEGGFKTLTAKPEVNKVKHKLRHNAWDVALSATYTF